MKIIATTLAVALILGNIGFASSDDLPPSYTPTVHQIIVKAATAYHIDPLPLYKVAKCESNLDIHAIGDHGLAIGLLQFHRETFNQYAKQLEIQNPDINNPSQQAAVSAYMFSLHRQSAWTCYGKLYGKM